MEARVDHAAHPPSPASIGTSTLRQLLFASEPARRTMAGRYGLDPGLSSNGLEHALWDLIGQPERDPEGGTLDDRDVFRAAVWAIASGSRPWAYFMQVEPEVRALLGDYAPAAAAGLGQEGFDRLRALLRGVTSGRDTRAVKRWAERLIDASGHHARLVAIRREIRGRAGGGMSLSDPELTACVSVVLGIAPSGFGSPVRLKAPGMGPALASEFLRNLGWSGFKPDRHVQRLLAAWFLDDADLRLRADALARVVGVRGRRVRDFLYFSLLGAARSPPGESVTCVDHLVWLYGSVVAPGGKPVPRAPWVP
jgi:hypothetical protein